MNRNSIIIYLFSVVLLLSCKNENKSHEKESHFIVTQAMLKDTTISKEHVCQIKSSQHIELRALETVSYTDLDVYKRQTLGKKHYTYRCLFNDTKDFKRSTIIPRDTKK